MPKKTEPDDRLKASGWYALVYLPENKFVSVRQSYGQIESEYEDRGFNLNDMVKSGKWLVCMVDIVENG